MVRTRGAVMCGVGALVATLALAGCSSGISEEDRAAFDTFAAERLADYPSAMSAAVPTSIKEMVLGGSGVTPVAFIVTGAFTDGEKVLPAPGAADPTAYSFVATFTLHESIKGTVPATFEVNLGPVSAAFDAASAARGAGDVVLFLTRSRASGEWVLADGGWSLAQSTGGNLSMPLVPVGLEAQYLTGVVDVSDVFAMAIAGSLDPNGSLTGGDDGVTDTQQDLIDKANELAGG